MPALIFLPILIPLITALITTLFPRSQRLQRWLNVAGAAALLGAGAALFAVVGSRGNPIGSGRWLDRAVRHQSRRRSLLLDHGVDGRVGGSGHGGLFGGDHRSSPRGVRLLSAAQRAGHGNLRRISDRRHLQPLRLVRSDVDGVVRPPGSRRRDAADGSRHQVRHDQFDFVRDLPLRRRHSVRTGRNAQHGRSQPEAARCIGARNRDDRGDAVFDSVRDQGGGISALLLASVLLSHAAGRRFGYFRPRY